MEGADRGHRSVPALLRQLGLLPHSSLKGLRTTACQAQPYRGALRQKNVRQKTGPTGLLCTVQPPVASVLEKEGLLPSVSHEGNFMKATLACPKLVFFGTPRWVLGPTPGAGVLSVPSGPLLAILGNR